MQLLAPDARRPAHRLREARSARPQQVDATYVTTLRRLGFDTRSLPKATSLDPAEAGIRPSPKGPVQTQQFSRKIIHPLSRPPYAPPGRGRDSGPDWIPPQAGRPPSACLDRPGPRGPCARPVGSAPPGPAPELAPVAREADPGSGKGPMLVDIMPLSGRYTPFGGRVRGPPALRAPVTRFGVTVDAIQSARPATIVRLHQAGCHLPVANPWSQAPQRGFRPETPGFRGKTRPFEMKYANRKDASVSGAGSSLCGLSHDSMSGGCRRV